MLYSFVYALGIAYFAMFTTLFIFALIIVMINSFRTKKKKQPFVNPLTGQYVESLYDLI